MALISPRRLGKSGLIHHTFNQPQIKENYTTIYIDIYPTSNLTELAKALSDAIIRTIRHEQKWHERFLQFTRSIQVGLKLDSVTGEPCLNIGLGDIAHPDRTISELIEYIESMDKPCVLAIDEFQQIREYPENTVEAFLRTLTQQCRRTTFIFCGSKRHTMTDIFFSPSKPFFQSVISQSLGPIPMETYIKFAGRLFSERGKRLDSFTAELIYRMFDGCTWYIQMMMNELFSLTKEGMTCSPEYIEFAWENIIMAQEDRYEGLLHNMAPKQKQLLYAIAAEKKAERITSGEFIRKHSLVSASSVQAALKTLLKNDIVTEENGIYRIYDYFFADYLANGH